MTTTKTPETTRSPRWWNEINFNWLVTLAALLIIAIPVGVANIYLGFMLGESPCTSCSFERFGMVVVGGLALLMVRYGPRYKYVAALAAASFFFLYSTIRHWNYHVIDDVGQGFASEVFGVHTYTWGAFVFWIVMAAVAVALIFIARDPGLRREFTGEQKPVKPFSMFQKVASVIIILIIASNAVQMFFLNGPPPFAGKGGPPRATFNIAQASKFWTADLWTRVLDKPVALAMSAPMPHIPGDYEKTGIDFTGDPASGPIAPSSTDLNIVERTEIGFPVTGVTSSGNAAGIAYDSESELFGLVSTDAGLYFVEDDFSTIVSEAVLDRPNGSDIGHTVDATFLGPNNLVAMAWNKTIYGAEQVDPGEVDELESWKSFTSSTGDLVEAPDGRALLFTARAREQFALGIAGDPATESYYVVSVPNEDNPQIVISQFADDHKLSREAVLGADPDAGLSDAEALAEYYPVGADFHDGNLYILSKEFNSLLVVDADTLTIIDVHGLPEIGDASDLVVTDDVIHVLSREDGTDVVYELDSL